MKQLPWIIAGTAVSLAAYYILNRPSPNYATGYDSVEGAAAKVGNWGTKQRFSGACSSLLGKAKQGIGHLAGDLDLMDQGTADQAIGAVKNSVGKVANAAGQTIHDLNV